MSAPTIITTRTGDGFYVAHIAGGPQWLLKTRTEETALSAGAEYARRNWACVDGQWRAKLNCGMRPEGPRGGRFEVWTSRGLVWSGSTAEEAMRVADACTTGATAEVEDPDQDAFRVQDQAVAIDTFQGDEDSQAFFRSWATTDVWRKMVGGLMQPMQP